LYLKEGHCYVMPFCAVREKVSIHIHRARVKINGASFVASRYNNMTLEHVTIHLFEPFVYIKLQTQDDTS